jgi:hypothetical protein
MLNDEYNRHCNDFGEVKKYAFVINRSPIPRSSSVKCGHQLTELLQELSA